MIHQKFRRNQCTALKKFQFYQIIIFWWKNCSTGIASASFSRKIPGQLCSPIAQQECLSCHFIFFWWKLLPPMAFAVYSSTFAVYLVNRRTVLSKHKRIFQKEKSMGICFNCAWSLFGLTLSLCYLMGRQVLRPNVHAKEVYKLHGKVLVGRV